MPHQPIIKGMMHEEVREQRTDDTPLRGAHGPRTQNSFRPFDRGLQPPLEVQKKPRIIRMMAYRTHDQAMIKIIKETFDIQINDPVRSPAPLPRGCDRIMR